MFTQNNLRALLNAQPFIPFRIHLSNGSSVEVRSREQVLALRQLAIVALLDPNAPDVTEDRWLNVWYMHVTSIEMLTPGAPALAPPEGPAGSPSSAPV